jgi:hypothetical protein
MSEMIAGVAMVMAMIRAPIVEGASRPPIPAVEGAVIPVIEGVIVDIGIRRRRAIVGLVCGAAGETAGQDKHCNERWAELHSDFLEGVPAACAADEEADGVIGVRRSPS